MALDACADEVMSLLHVAEAPSEICVERARPFREAEARGQLAEILRMLAAYG